MTDYAKLVDAVERAVEAGQHNGVARAALLAYLREREAEIERLRAELEAAHRANLAGLNELEAEVAALRKDAERYRWLRNLLWVSGNPSGTLELSKQARLDPHPRGYRMWGDKLDAAIDATISNDAALADKQS